MVYGTSSGITYMTLNGFEVKMLYQMTGKSTWKVLGCTCKYIEKSNVLKYNSSTCTWKIEIYLSTFSTFKNVLKYECT